MNLIWYRVVREGKERRRLWAQRKTPKPAQDDDLESAQDDDAQTENPNEASGREGMLPNDIVQLLAAREKYFSSFYYYPLCKEIHLSWSINY